MGKSEEVTLEAAAFTEAALLASLLQLYLHDLSEAFDIDLGPDGRFEYHEKFPLYWSEPKRRFPFLIRYEGRVAGFILVTRGPRATFDVAEFFVLRRYRRDGVGRRAASLLWDRLPGRWTVRVLKENKGALAFWTGILEGAGRIDRRDGWRVFTFDSRKR